MTNAKKHAKKKQHWRGNWHFRVQWQSALPALALLCFAAKFGMAQMQGLPVLRAVKQV